MNRPRHWMAFAALVVVLTACSTMGGTTSPTQPPSTIDMRDNPSGGSGATEASSAEPTDQPVTFKALAFKGRGDKVVKFKIPEDAAATAAFTHTGSSNFVVESLAADGSTNDLLVNEIGRFKGTRLFDADGHSVAFKIDADGAWTVAIKPVSQARAWNLAAPLSGAGDDVIRVTGSIDGLASSVIKHTGGSNFVVTAYSSDGRDLLINEIGKYSGEVVMPSGLLLLEIEADGKWSVSVPA